jgi:hypothetical protein
LDLLVTYVRPFIILMILIILMTLIILIRLIRLKKAFRCAQPIVTQTCKTLRGARPERLSTDIRELCRDMRLWCGCTEHHSMKISEMNVAAAEAVRCLY